MSIFLLLNQLQSAAKPPTLGVHEVDNVVVVLEDVHLLNAGDGVNTQTLQSVLQPLVISGGGLVDSFFLPARWWQPRSGQNASAPP